MLDAAGRFVQLIKRHVIAAGDVNQHTARPLHRHIVEQWVGNGGFGSFDGAFVAFGFACAHHGFAHLVHHRANIGEIEIDKTWLNHQIGDACHARMQDFIGHGESLGKGCLRIGNAEQVLVRNDNQRIDFFGQLFNACLGRAHAPTAFEIKWRGNHTDR